MPIFYKTIQGGRSIYGRRRILHQAPDIKRISVDKFTESSVWFGDRRHARSTEYDLFHETFGAAKAHLMKEAQAALDDAIKDAEAMRKYMADLEAIPSPE